MFDTFQQIVQDFLHDGPSVVCLFPVVHDYDRHVVAGHDFRHFRISLQSPHVVDDVSPASDGRFRHLCFVRIDGYRCVYLLRQTGDDREDPSFFFFGAHIGGAFSVHARRSGRLSSYVDDVRPIFNKPSRVFDGRIGESYCPPSEKVV